jgi:hypothetical protein
MSRFELLLILTFVGLVVWAVSDFSPFNKNSYLDEKVLDMARPFNATIDVEFLEKLNSAYEQQ